LPPATIPSDTTGRGVSRPVQVADKIKEWVVEHRLNAGDRLPNEAELMARFGMAKGTIREAMRILEAQGLIKTRTGPGGGSFVHEVSKERARALLGNYFYFKHLTIADIYQLRSVLEPELAASLAGTLDAETLEALRDNIAEFDSPATDAEQERERHIVSLRFHAMLAEQSRNPFLAFLIDFMACMLSDLTVYRRLFDPPNTELWRRGRDYQTRLLDALRHGDSAAARRIMSEHMSTAWRLMEMQEAEMVKRFISE